MKRRFGTVKVAKNSMNEDAVQELSVKLLRLKYPNVIFQANYLSGVKLTIGLAKKAKVQGHEKSMPDLMIFKPKGEYHGLFIELKAPQRKIYKKDETDYSCEHYREQADKIYALIDEGYAAMFANTFEQASKLIKDYMDGDHSIVMETMVDFIAKHLVITNK